MTSYADVDIPVTVDPDQTTTSTAEEPADAVEAATDPAPPAPADPPPDDPHVRKLARERSELRRERDALESQRRELESLRSQTADLAALRELVARDPEAAAERLGLDYEKWTRAILDGKRAAPDPIAPVRGELEQIKADLKAQREELARERAEAQQARVEMAHAGAVRAAADRFPGLLTHDDADIGRAIAAVIASRPDEYLDTAGAAGILEKKLQSDYQRLHRAYGGKPSPKPRTAPPPTPETGTARTDALGDAGRPLTQSDTATTRPSRPLTREERVRRAYAAIDAVQAAQEPSPKS